MILRLLVLAAVIGAVYLAVWQWERRPWRGRRLAPGLTMVVTYDCRLCDAAVAALRSVDPTLPIRSVLADRAPNLGVHSVPTVLVADQEGNVVLRRSGRAGIHDAALLATTARTLAG